MYSFVNCSKNLRYNLETKRINAWKTTTTISNSEKNTARNYLRKFVMLNSACWPFWPFVVLLNSIVWHGVILICAGFKWAFAHFCSSFTLKFFNINFLVSFRSLHKYTACSLSPPKKMMTKTFHKWRLFENIRFHID